MHIDFSIKDEEFDINSVAFSWDNQMILAGKSNYSIRLHDIETNTNEDFQCTGPVNSVSFINPSVICSGNANGDIQVTVLHFLIQDSSFRSNWIVFFSIHSCTNLKQFKLVVGHKKWSILDSDYRARCSQTYPLQWRRGFCSFYVHKCRSTLGCTEQSGESVFDLFLSFIQLLIFSFV